MLSYMEPKWSDQAMAFPSHLEGLILCPIVSITSFDKVMSRLGSKDWDKIVEMGNTVPPSGSLGVVVGGAPYFFPLFSRCNSFTFEDMAPTILGKAPRSRVWDRDLDAQKQCSSVKYCKREGNSEQGRRKLSRCGLRERPGWGMGAVKSKSHQVVSPLRKGTVFCIPYQ